MRSMFAFLAVGCLPEEDRSLPPLAADVLAFEADLLAGEAVFHDNCAECHAENGTFAVAYPCGLYGKPVDLAAQELEDIVLQVIDGSYCMPSFGEGTGGEVELSAEQIADVATWVDHTW